MSDHAEATELAQRLAAAETDDAGDGRRALLLYWYGSGASRLLLEADAARRPELGRLSALIAAVAGDPRPTPEALRRIGFSLEALVTRPDAEWSRRRAGAV